MIADAVKAHRFVKALWAACEKEIIMTNNELFINATRSNYQFPFRGMINVIDLWDLSLTNLDSVFKTLNAEAKKSEEESLLNTKSKED